MRTASRDNLARQILGDRIDARRQGVGMVAGIVDAARSRVIAHGSFSATDPRPVDGDTMFEIASITKVFTALLLADMVLHDEVRLDQPVADLLPPNARIPQRSGRRITLADLSTHTSGLPRMPANFEPAADPADPYVGYTEARLYDFLADHELVRDIGASFEYSNLGVALLGQALAHRAGLDYETLIRKRVLKPLSMSDTTIALSAEQAKRLAPGHDAALQPAKNWNLELFVGAGGLRSTVNDMLKFLAAATGRADTALAPAFKALLKTRRPAVLPDVQACLGWMLRRRPNDRIASHNGQTGGYRGFAGYRVKAGVGVVLLSNASTINGIDDIGLHLLDSTLPLLPATKPHIEVSVDPALYDRYAGRYAIEPEFILTVTRRGDRLFVQATGQDDFEVFPETPTGFFYRIVDAQLTFDLDAAGQARSLTLHQNGQDMPGPRLT